MSRPRVPAADRVRVRTGLRLRRNFAHRPLLMGASDDDEVLSVEEQMQAKIRLKLDEGKFEQAYAILKRSPMTELKKSDAILLLNNIDNIVNNLDKKDEESEESGKGSRSRSPPPSAEVGMARAGSFEKYERAMIDVTTFIYKRVDRHKTLRGFGSVQNEYVN